MQMHKVVEGSLSCWGICEQGDWWGLVTYEVAYGSRRKDGDSLGAGLDSAPQIHRLERTADELRSHS